MTNEATAAPRRRYLTWRYPDRHFSKVHILGDDALPLCGGRPGREMGRPTPPIPEDALCEDCLARDGSTTASHARPVGGSAATAVDPA